MQFQGHFKAKYIRKRNVRFDNLQPTLYFPKIVEATQFDP